jgi:hypothetical protein
MDVLRLEPFMNFRSKVQRLGQAQAAEKLYSQLCGQGFTLLSLDGDHTVCRQVA